MNKIKVKNLYKIYGPRPKEVIPLLKKGLNKDDILQKTKHSVGVNNINFSAREGEIFVIMGLSGSGKSTLIRCMNRLIEPTQGKILIDGEDLTKMDKEALREVRRHKLAMVFQHFALFPHKTVLENVEYGFEIQHIKKSIKKEIALQALKQVGLKEWHNHKPANLSGGMQQRVGLARALAIDPDILLMDEAFSALDPLIRRDMQNELLNLQSKLHKTIIFITHDLDEALRIGDRIAILNEEGQIVQIGEPEEILSNPANDYVAKFVQGVNRLKVLTAEDLMFRPDALIHVKDGPNMALKTMTREGFSSLYVVNSDKKVAGVIDIDGAVQAKKDRSKNLAKYLDRDFAQARPNTPLTELLPMTSQTAYPIAITDDSERLLGIIVRVTILSSLAEGSVADDQSSNW